jgi:hypothetical protein
MAILSINGLENNTSKRFENIEQVLSAPGFDIASCAAAPKKREA